MTPERPVILIGGVGRVGKSRLARTIAEQTGFDIIQCDRFRMSFFSIADEQERYAERFRRYGEAIEGRRAGLIIEGDDLIHRNRADGTLAKQGLVTNDSRLSLDLLEHLQNRYGARAFVVGCLDGDPETMLRHMRQYDRKIGRIVGLSESDMQRLIQGKIRHSRQLRDMAVQKGIPYLELRGDRPALGAAAERILSEINWPVVRKRKPLRYVARRLRIALQAVGNAARRLLG